ncbi:MAG: 23S rRNA methyltransferase [Gammaproteobacteria bacterium]|nr:23S rRNA methyltransferase [Gammaproteobacteria bacterium]MDH5694362.1 23S rRNA methyltransferase [Gammaproteobacteria bacterium]
MAKKKNPWIQRQDKDKFVKAAQVQGYRSRAAFKLIEINEKDKLIKPGMIIVDLGAAPGGWSQVASRLAGDRGRVIALDLLEMDSMAGVEIIQGDFSDDGCLKKLEGSLGGQKVDLVICDMAPNMSGMKAVDQPRAMYLSELALEFATRHLRPNGDFLVKLFQGEGVDSYRQQVRQSFAKLLTRKPNSSRSESREFYLLARNLVV